MTTKKQLAARLERNRAIAAQDAANRCSFCRRALPKRGAYERAADPSRRFCNIGCWQDQWDADEWQARAAGQAAGIRAATRR